MSTNDKLLPQYIYKLKDNAKAEKRQIEILKLYLKQIKSVYNEDLVQYNNISSKIIKQEELFEKQNKQLNKIQNKLYTILSIINEDFILSLKENLKSIKAETNRILLLCFGYPNIIDGSICIPIHDSIQFIEMLKYAETLLEYCFIKNNPSFSYLKTQISSLKSLSNTFSYQINQIINYINLIQEKITIINDKSSLLSNHALLNKEKDEYFIYLKEKEKEINRKYGLYKIKCGYIKRIGDLLKQYKEYELLGKNYSLNNDMTSKITSLINTKVDKIDDNEDDINNNLCIQKKYEDNISEGVSCSFLNDYSVNEDLLQFRQENRMITNGNEIISLSPICEKEAKTYFYNSSLNKKKKTSFYNKANGNSNNDNSNNIQQDKTSSGGNGELSEQISQMIDDTSRYDKQMNITNNIGEGIVSHSISNINSNYKSKADIQILRGKQNKNANFSLK